MQKGKLLSSHQSKLIFLARYPRFLIKLFSWCEIDSGLNFESIHLKIKSHNIIDAREKSRIKANLYLSYWPLFSLSTIWQRFGQLWAIFEGKRSLARRSPGYSWLGLGPQAWRSAEWGRLVVRRIVGNKSMNLSR